MVKADKINIFSLKSILMRNSSAVLKEEQFLSVFCVFTEGFFFICLVDGQWKDL